MRTGVNKYLNRRNMHIQFRSGEPRKYHGPGGIVWMGNRKKRRAQASSDRRQKGK